ncbi:hypothetical protein [Sphingobacterium siyangense]|uniref:hypothetical protein n=1 Tax=Sphingobacterium siyangense TaxID=459529 RepID=UPI00301A8748
MKKLCYECKFIPFITFLCAFVILVSSCSKNRDKDGVEEDGKTRLIVTVLGTEDSGGGNTAKAAPGVIVAENKVLPSEIVSQSAGFDTRFSVVTVENTASRVVTINNDDKDGVSVRAAALPDDIYYKVLLYKASDNSFVTSSNMKSGEPLQIAVDGGVQYKWIAYSYNTANLADLPTVANLAAPAVSLGQNKDFLYANGTITPVGNQSTPLGIVFKRKMARIGVEVNTVGMFADLNQATLTSTQLKTGNIDLLTGNISNSLTNVGTATASATNAIAGYAYNDRKVAYFYTADPTTLANLNVTLTSLIVNLDSYAVSQGQPTRNFGTLSTVFSSPNFTPVLGQSRTFRIDMLESPITTVSNTPVVGSPITTRWARANLYYAGASDHNPYRFHHLNQMTQAGNTFFSAGATRPQIYQTSGSEADPCLLVYPAGVWRQATQNDYEGLVGRLLLSAKTPTYVANQYIQYAATGTGAPYPTNNLRFNLNGSAVGLSLVAGLIDLNLGFYGQNAEYWTSTKLLNLGPLASVGQIHFDGSNSSAGLTTDILDISLLSGLGGGLNVVKSNFMNIRCVRN